MNRALIGVLVFLAVAFGAFDARAQRVIRDYLYAHLVSGRVVTTGGRAVPDAEVLRVRSAAGTEVYGSEHLCRQRTDGQGRFEFRHRGIGRRPTDSDTWYLLVRSPGCPDRHETLRVPWVEPPEEGDPQGYVLEGITVTLDCP